MSFPPNLYLIGAQKAGTTFLATLLGQHDDICLATPKEPHFFTRNWDRGADWYQNCFANPESPVLLDASPSYAAAPLVDEQHDGGRAHPTAGVPDRIASLAPQARFIYLMRDPVKRAYSSYWHAVRAGNELRPVSEALRHDGTYLRMGCYRYQLQHYLERFERERFLLLFFEDFVRDPQATANDCLDWLGLDMLSEFHLSKGKNESYTYGSMLSRIDAALARVGGIKRLAKTAQKVVPHRLLHAMRSSMTKKIPPLSATDREWLVSFYEEPTRLLEKDLGITHSDWLRA